jgi:hypothetical protein
VVSFTPRPLYPRGKSPRSINSINRVVVVVAVAVVVATAVVVAAVVVVAAAVVVG